MFINAQPVVNTASSAIINAQAVINTTSFVVINAWLGLRLGSNF
ncbi:hypothetical protein [Nostoc sp. ChiVER01]|nr:hypothetical protein [Nostoc sp. ChiVER01]